jgi:hypothetical protein
VAQSDGGVKTVVNGGLDMGQDVGAIRVVMRLGVEMMEWWEKEWD